jgi:hypothetical protein
MAWAVRFIPNECDSIAVSINNQYWMTWQSAQGDVTIPLAAQWINEQKIHIYGAVNPRGKNGSMKVLWDGNDRQDMDFDNDEDHDVDAN